MTKVYMELSMKANDPAIGISKLNDSEDYIGYRVECECTDPDHAIYAYVEKDECFTSLSIYVTAETPFVNMWGRIKGAVRILLSGVIKYEAHALLRDQAALNYAQAIINSVNPKPQKKGSPKAPLV